MTATNGHIGGVNPKTDKTLKLENVRKGEESVTCRSQY